ncbi:hypothetical protein TRFO_07413 [Tritrichomonas foetus]|uniref:Uncharacterized protein n=1 Tax=Tritrichomonas foetus TaxID=1144522 RepID=A0A1J4JRS6_9EUKA|nr:hypothetical protein TRFO_07413 [Tritrichomonas foetus]|eukprot:OHT01839.1 hypothetical protein TRFO_07413 [Tritrichomonas foetus]
MLALFLYRNFIMNPPQKEELSFVPFHLKRPLQPNLFKQQKSLAAQIHDAISLPSFLNILYSFTEVQYLRTKYPNTKPLTDSVAKLMIEYSKNPSTRQNTLEQLNAMIISQTPYTETINIFKSVHLPQVLVGWFQGSLSPIEKSLLLNIISFCFEFLEIPRGSLGSVWCTILESAMASTGSAAKKHLFLLLRIVSYICETEKIEDPLLRYSFVQNLVVSSSFENPLNFQFLLLGNVPDAFIAGEKLINELENKSPISKFIHDHNVISKTENDDCRAFLMNCGNTLPQFAKFITQVCQANSRILYPNMNFDLLYPIGSLPDSKAAQLADSLRERDLIVFAGWSNAYVTQKLLYKSNFFDGLVLRHFLLANPQITLPQLCFQYFIGEMKSVDKSETPQNLLAVKPEHEENFPALELSLGIALHFIADLIGYSSEKVTQYVTEKAVKNVHKFAESSGSKLINAEAAYAIARYVRWYPPFKTKKNGQFDKRDPFQDKLITYIYNNLEEFELFTKYNNDIKTDINGQLTEEEMLNALRKHCESIQLKISL